MGNMQTRISNNFSLCRFRSWRLRIAILGCLFVLLLLYLRGTLNGKALDSIRYDEKHHISEVIPETRRPNVKKLLLVYSTWFGNSHWGPWNEALLEREFAYCSGSKNCIATYNKSKLHVADALLFHGRDVELNRNGIYSASTLRKLRRENGKYSQKWIFLAHETPQRDENIYKPFDGVFNWTATYNRNSDVFIPYGQFKRRNPTQTLTINYAKMKKYLAAWPVSNCGVKLRLEYALELEKYIPLTVYGGCGRLFKNKGECPRQNKDCHDRLGLYKFYFAFENEFCQDWMTEKYWRAIKVGSVPVVMGENFEGLAIPGSYIDVNNFTSIRKLADYLLFLDKNDEEYNKYFAHKSIFTEGGMSYFCAICDKLNSVEFEKETEVRLSERYGFRTTCHQDAKRITELEEQVKEAKMGRTNKTQEKVR